METKDLAAVAGSSGCLSPRTRSTPPESVLAGVSMMLAEYYPDAPPNFLKEALERYFGVQPPEAEPKPPPLQPLLSAEQAQKLLGVSPMTLHRVVKSGGLPVVQLSKRRIAFELADIKEYIESHKTRRSRRTRGRARR